jgi:hypothetical protein
VNVTLHTHSAAAAAAPSTTKCPRATCPFAAHSQAPPQMRGGAPITRHTSHMTSVAGHCCVACLQSAGSHGPACQQVVWHRPSSQSASTTSTPAAAPRAQALAAPLQPRGAGGSEVELVLECAAALRAGAAGEANTLQVTWLWLSLFLVIMCLFQLVSWFPSSCGAHAAAAIHAAMRSLFFYAEGSAALMTVIVVITRPCSRSHTDVIAHGMPAPHPPQPSPTFISLI